MKKILLFALFCLPGSAFAELCPDPYWWVQSSSTEGYCFNGSGLNHACPSGMTGTYDPVCEAQQGQGAYDCWRCTGSDGYSCDYGTAVCTMLSIMWGAEITDTTLTMVGIFAGVLVLLGVMWAWRKSIKSVNRA